MSPKIYAQILSPYTMSMDKVRETFGFDVRQHVMRSVADTAFNISVGEELDAIVDEELKRIRHNIEHARYLEAVRYKAWLMNTGIFVPVSPIVSCHPMARMHNLPGEFEFWQEYCMTIMRSGVEECHVLMLDGYKDSTGVRGEIEGANNLGIRLHWIEPLKDGSYLFHTSDPN